jgi:CRISPR-associated protein Csd1
MLLQRLVAYQPTQADGPQQPYSRVRAVRWQLDLDANGRYIDLTNLVDAADPTRKNGVPRLVPHLARSSGIAPCLGADDIQYVLGWADDKTRPDRADDCHQAFVALCQGWAAAEPDDNVAAAVAAFYSRDGVESVEKPPKWWSKDLVLLVVDGRPVTDSETLWRHWQRTVEARKSSTGANTGPGTARQGICLVCGTTGSLLNRMPQALPKNLIPRADQEVALVSANKKIHTYDFREGLGTAPICIRCGQRSVENLTAILSDDDHTFSYRGQSTRLAWWTSGGDAADTIAALDADPQDIKDFLERTRTGIPPGWDPDTARFYAVTISGNTSRLVVHEWIDMPLPRVLHNVRMWFADHAIVDRRAGENTHLPLWLLILATGRWIPATGGYGSYARLDDRSADRPHDVARRLLRAALLGSHHGVLPPTLLAHLVRRIRTDQRLDEPRAALLRLLLTRIPSAPLEAPMPGLDESYNHPAYLAGRLFAVIESIQRRAYPRDDRPNTTFFNRYFSGAVTNPAVALIQGTQLSAAWLKKLEGGTSRNTANSRDARAAAALRSRLADLYARYDAASGGPPRRIDVEQQATFVLGYFHQTAHDQQQARQARTTTGHGTSPQRAEPDPAMPDLAEPDLTEPDPTASDPTDVEPVQS